jgi:hypothetical protein
MAKMARMTHIRHGAHRRLGLVATTFRSLVWGLSLTCNATPNERKTMTDATKQKFLVLYLIPASVMADWAKTDPATRQAAEEKMRAAWGEWMSEHAKMIISTEAGGKTKRVTASGVSDTKNDIILCSFVEAESHEAAAQAFENHPHLQIPQSSIDVWS